MINTMNSMREILEREPDAPTEIKLSEWLSDILEELRKAEEIEEEAENFSKLFAKTPCGLIPYALAERVYDQAKARYGGVWTPLGAVYFLGYLHSSIERKRILNNLEITYERR